MAHVVDDLMGVLDRDVGKKLDGPCANTALTCSTFLTFIISPRPALLLVLPYGSLGCVYLGLRLGGSEIG